jgi:putative phosphoribosyl transferase
MFRDRTDAGEKLAWALEKYRDNRPVVLAIPKGGVEVGYRVAKYLNADFSIIVSRKLPFPDNPEAGFGAIAEDDSTFILDYAARSLSHQIIERIEKEQTLEIKRRIEILRKGKSLPEVANRTVILVDDGIAMGSTMRVSIMMCKNKKAGKIVAALPVASPSNVAELEKIVDDVVVLEQPLFFRAVAQVYANWYDVPDAEVIRMMEQWEKKDN